ncbi:protein APCDD1-like isoform X2 [Hoplias malabaricus]|uniref:protein APCDD1-like isoform X2 n=1 Tax=Hoplias malabaricus TaxID=27720 RepID=UPI003461C47C
MYGTALIYLLEIVWMMCFWQALCVKGSNPWEVPTGKLTPPANISSKLLWEPQCQTHLRYLQDGTKITASIPPRLDGQWVSSRCEVRTGPEFLTRSYIFYPRPMQLFKALQHYYLDSDCQVPAYSLLIQGKLNMRQASWITRGATEAEYTLHKVSLVIHNQQSAYRLTVQVPSACLDLGPEGHLLPHHQYELFNVKAEKDCLGTLHFSMMELQLLRVETHYHAHGQLSKELFLGDVHTDWNQRVHYRPTGYQEPLQNAMHHIHPCPVCALVYHSSEKHPPVLPPSWSFPLDLNGHWVSQRCEARPAVLFLTRLFIFDKERRSWEGTYHHYSDPNCRHRTFSIVASGRYSHMEPSAKVRGATELVFTVTHTKVTVVDLSLVQLLNSSEEGSCGQAGRWEPGTEQDVTWTAGCKVLGILLPHTEYELFKMERDHKGRHLLFIGERPPDGGNPDRPVKRPTSFQTPMVHCSARARAPPRYSPYSGTTSGVSSAMVLCTIFIRLAVKKQLSGM